jgi:hypothetical protein
MRYDNKQATGINNSPAQNYDNKKIINFQVNWNIDEGSLRRISSIH